MGRMGAASPPELTELTTVLAAAREPVVIGSAPLSCASSAAEQPPRAMPFCAGGPRFSEDKRADSASARVAPSSERLAALEDAAARLSAGLREDRSNPRLSDNANAASGDWAGVPRGVRNPGAGSSNGRAGSDCSGATRRSSLSAASVYSGAAGKRELRPLGLDQGSEARAVRRTQTPARNPHLLRHYWRRELLLQQRAPLPKTAPDRLLHPRLMLRLHGRHCSKPGFLRWIRRLKPLPQRRPIWVRLQPR